MRNYNPTNIRLSDTTTTAAATPAGGEPRRPQSMSRPPPPPSCPPSPLLLRQACMIIRGPGCVTHAFIKEGVFVTQPSPHTFLLVCTATAVSAPPSSTPVSATASIAPASTPSSAAVSCSKEIALKPLSAAAKRRPSMVSKLANLTHTLLTLASPASLCLTFFFVMPSVASVSYFDGKHLAIVNSSSIGGHSCVLMGLCWQHCQEIK